MTRAAVLGAGAWGTTFAAVLADAGTEVTLWGRDDDVVRSIRDTRRHESAVPGVDLPAGMPKETFLALKKAWVCQQRLDISLVGEKGKGKPRPKPGPKPKLKAKDKAARRQQKKKATRGKAR